MHMIKRKFRELTGMFRIEQVVLVLRVELCQTGYQRPAVVAQSCIVVKCPFGIEAYIHPPVLK